MIGAHLPINSFIEDAKTIGAKAVQIFAKSPQIRTKSRSGPANIQNIPIFIHASYLVHLTGPLRSDDIESLLDDIQFGFRWSTTPGTVVHPGSSPEGPSRDCVFPALGIVNQCQYLDQIANNITALTSKFPDGAKLIIENQPRLGTKICVFIEEFIYIWKKLLEPARQKTGFCIDTCHAYISGYDMTPDGIQKLFGEFDKYIGYRHLSLIHLNDARNPRKDEHEDLFQGYIGNSKLGGSVEAIMAIVRIGKKNNIPMIIERSSASLADLTAQIKAIQ